MSRRSNKSYVSKIERELQKIETADPYIWLQTASGDFVTLEFEFGWQSSMICQSLECGFGLTRSKPICLSPGIAKEALEMIFDYFRYSQAPGLSCEECQLYFDKLLKKDERTLWMLLRAANCLQHKGLTDMIRGTLAQNTENSLLEVEQDLSKSFEQCVKGEQLEPQKNPNGDLRTRLSNKLLAKQKKKLDEVEKKVEEEVEAQKREDRSVDDLISFINGDGDNKGIQTSKKKKKNHKKGKEKKKTFSTIAFSSTESSASKKVTENHEQDMNASDSANRSGSFDDTLKLLGTQEDSFNVKGDTIDDDLEPALMEEIDRLAC